MEVRRRKTALRDMGDMIIDLLPPDIKTDIFSRLPLDSVIKCKLLCKTWRTIIDELLRDPFFISKHTHRLLSSPPTSYRTSFLARENFYNLSSHDESPIRDDHNDNDNDWSIVGTCNGLVCLATESKFLQDHNVYICNPFTGEYVNLLPQSNQFLEKQRWPQWMSPNVAATGFGYHPCTKEYKFVRIIYSGGKLIYVSTYTLGSGRWSTKDVEFPYPTSRFCSELATTAVGLLFNGVLYWSISLKAEGNTIALFKLDTEEFRLVPSPLQSRESADDELGVLGGCLCVIRTKTRDGSKDIWVRNKEEKYEEEIYTWTKKFRIKPKGYQIERAITPFVPYEHILLNYFYMEFDSYDRNTRRLNHLIDKYTISFKIVDDQCEILPYMSKFELLPYMSKFEMIPYTKSLVSLKALGECSYFVPRRERKRKRKRNQVE